MDEAGEFLIEEMRSVLRETLAEEPGLERALLYECTAVPPGMDRCTRALLFTRCFWQRLQHPDLAPDHPDNIYTYEHYWP